MALFMLVAESLPTIGAAAEVPPAKAAAARPDIATREALAADDPCLAAGSGEGHGRCAFSALQMQAAKRAAQGATSLGASGEAARSAATCAGLEAPENAGCRSVVSWAAAGGRNDPNAARWFREMQAITGVDYVRGTVEDFQRLYFCAPPGGHGCGSAPCSCSQPPCGTCYGGSAAPPEHRSCADDGDSIKCGPPSRPLGYKGRAWPTMSFPGAGAMHIFAVGDWGGMDGSLNPIEGRPPIVAYSGGGRPGPSVFPRTRWNKMHDVELCTHSQFIECFNTRGQPPCAAGCGYVAGIDDRPQQLVAATLRSRAALKDPQYLLNVGDNFYWGGIEKNCGTPMDQISYTAHHQFNQIFEGVYSGPGLDGKPWLSVLGNHDWGGRVFNNGWDQQIAYTWSSNRWLMPAPYWSVRAEFPDQGFSVDIFMVDSNVEDAKDPPQDSEHNICGSAHNPPDADCSAADGPTSIATCKGWFETLWSEQGPWLSRKLSASTADWQIAVTHFPCGSFQSFWRSMHSLGLDLLVTGHRHDQELWLPSETYRNHMGGLTCLVTGGGGGITSEATPNPLNTVDWYGEAEYGFYDLVISKSIIAIQSINWNGTVVKTAVVHPR